MSGSPRIHCRVSANTKARLAALAQAHSTTESALVQRFIELAVLQSPGANEEPSRAVEPAPRGARLYVRLRSEDYRLLRERAQGRGMAGATYASMLLRAHLRAVAPLPDRKYEELRSAVAALNALGRNLNQIARVANETGQTNGPNPADLRAMLRALEGLRNHIKALMAANTSSWEAGNE